MEYHVRNSINDQWRSFRLHVFGRKQFAENVSSGE